MAQDVGKAVGSCKQDRVPSKDLTEPVERRAETGKAGRRAQSGAKVLSSWTLAAHFCR